MGQRLSRRSLSSGSISIRQIFPSAPRSYLAGVYSLAGTIQLSAHSEGTVGAGDVSVS